MCRACGSCGWARGAQSDLSCCILPGHGHRRTGGFGSRCWDASWWRRDAATILEQLPTPLSADLAAIHAASGRCMSRLPGSNRPNRRRRASTRLLGDTTAATGADWFRREFVAELAQGFLIGPCAFPGSDPISGLQASSSRWPDLVICHYLSVHLQRSAVLPRIPSSTAQAPTRSSSTMMDRETQSICSSVWACASRAGRRRQLAMLPIFKRPPHAVLICSSSAPKMWNSEKVQRLALVLEDTRPEVAEALPATSADRRGEWSGSRILVQDVASAAPNRQLLPRERA